MAHVPVLAREVAELLDLKPGDTVVDCTFGAGGHASVLEPMLAGRGCYVAIDRDPEAQIHFERFAARAGAETRFMRGNFSLVLRNQVDPRPVATDGATKSTLLREETARPAASAPKSVTVAKKRSAPRVVAVAATVPEVPKSTNCVEVIRGTVRSDACF